MRILYFFEELDSPMFQWQRIHFIDELQRHGCSIEIFNPLLFNSAEIANEEVVDKLRKQPYDLFFTNVCYEKMLFVETLQEIRMMGIPSLCLRCDNLVIPFNDKELAPFFDLVWLTSIETKYLYDRWRVNSFFAPYAANPYSFPFQTINIHSKVCFVGTPYGSRSIMINSLTRNAVPVDVYFGQNHQSGKSIVETKYDIITQSKNRILFDRVKFKEGRKLLLGAAINKIKGQITIQDNYYLSMYPSVEPSDISSLYSKYALCLASTSANHTDALIRPLKIINLRNFEIPMSGGLALCKYNKELAEYFQDEVEIVFYKTEEELIDKAKFYLSKANQDRIISMKLAARKKAENEHTWWNRFTIAFEKLGLHC